ncbi:MFS transporter [Streptomyces griseus]|uniref:MFS transporter n=1 Tax=Streptomyces stephensoniae TaxID=3375367 RepID=A0ABU2W505_9ACTN|nr:MFS transporter [Streptomyces griseus]MDT0492610.1 MFS transporter [Streptomyces griseus]
MTQDTTVTAADDAESGGGPDRTLPGAGDRPPVGRGWTARYTIASTGMWLGVLTPMGVQLARQAEKFAPESKTELLGLATGVGALVTMLAVPLLGAASDRTRSRFGRRRPWIAGGAAVGALGLALLSMAPGPGWMLAGWVVAQLGLSSVQAGLVATVPDRVPREQLGSVAGWAGLSQMLGALLGTVVVNQLVKGLSAGYLACAALVLVAVVPFLIGHAERDARAGAGSHAGDDARAGQGLRAVAVEPKAPRPVVVTAGGARRGLREPDVLWTWVSKFLVVLGFALITQYLLYYLTDELRVPDPQRATMMITAVTVLSAMASALGAGRWSDRVGRRKVFVAGGGLLMAVGGTLMAVAPAWPVALCAGLLVGAGFGTFLAVDLAVVASVLPSARDTGRDLGLFAVAVAAPQVLAPVLAVPVLAVAGYGGLYLLVALVTALGGVLVLRVRSVA